MNIQLQITVEELRALVMFHTKQHCELSLKHKYSEAQYHYNRALFFIEILTDIHKK